MVHAETTAAVATAGALFVDASARLVALLFIDFQFPFRETEDDRRRGARLSVDLRPLLSNPELERNLQEWKMTVLQSAQFWPIRTEHKHTGDENRSEKYGLIGCKDKI